MKVYKTTTYGIEITEYEVIRETDKFYILASKRGGSDFRTAKSSGYETYHLSRNTAENHLLNLIDQRIKYRQEEIEKLKKEREKLILNSGKE